jgi:hypothetical protein
MRFYCGNLLKYSAMNFIHCATVLETANSSEFMHLHDYIYLYKKKICAI